MLWRLIKYILSCFDEEYTEKSEASKAGYKTIAEIGKERIRRDGQKIKQDNANKPGIDQLDIGFVKKLATRHPLQAVFRDAGFVSDSVKINVDFQAHFTHY